MKSLIIELRGAEGGDHSKILVQDMATIYRKVAERNNLSFTVLEKKSGFASFLVEGKNVKLFENEAGGHRWQTVSPTDKKGRVHTSTVTVAVLDPEDDQKYELDLKDVEIKTTRSGGNGGQNVNKVESCVVVTHRPTKISVRISNRDQHKNKILALRILAERLSELERQEYLNDRSKKRKDQLGNGMRGCKIRTYSCKNNKITDHRLGTEMTYKRFVKGYISDLWK